MSLQQLRQKRESIKRARRQSSDFTEGKSQGCFTLSRFKGLAFTLECSQQRLLLITCPSRFSPSITSSSHGVTLFGFTSPRKEQSEEVHSEVMYKVQVADSRDDSYAWAAKTNNSNEDLAGTKHPFLGIRCSTKSCYRLTPCVTQVCDDWNCNCPVSAVIMDPLFLDVEVAVIPI